MDAAAVQELVGRSPQRTVAEEKLLELLLANEELRKIVLPRLETADYEELATAPIFRALMKLDEQGREVSFDSLNEDAEGDSLAAELLPRLMVAEQPESFDESLAAADSCLNALRLLRLNRRIDEVSFEIAEAERAGDNARRDTLAIEHLQLSKQRNNFLPPPRQ